MIFRTGHPRVFDPEMDKARYIIMVGKWRVGKMNNGSGRIGLARNRQDSMEKQTQAVWPGCLSGPHQRLPEGQWVVLGVQAGNRGIVCRQVDEVPVPGGEPLINRGVAKDIRT